VKLAKIKHCSQVYFEDKKYYFCAEGYVSRWQAYLLILIHVNFFSFVTTTSMATTAAATTTTTTTTTIICIELFQLTQILSLFAPSEFNWIFNIILTKPP
jgi:hypothetical protein